MFNEYLMRIVTLLNLSHKSFHLIKYSRRAKPSVTLAAFVFSLVMRGKLVLIEGQAGHEHLVALIAQKAAAIAVLVADVSLQFVLAVKLRPAALPRALERFDT